MRHAWALKRLLNQFSAEDLRTLNPGARAKLHSLIDAHAAAFKQETRSLRQELQPVFFPAQSLAEAQSSREISPDASLARVVAQLFETGSANEQVISTAFTVSTQGASVSAIAAPQFWRALLTAESLAEQIQRATSNK